MPPFESLFESLFLLPLGILIGWACWFNTVSRLKNDLADEKRVSSVLRFTLERERQQFNQAIASQNQLANALAGTINRTLAEVKSYLAPASPGKRNSIPFVFVEEDEQLHLKGQYDQ